jgi:hypothetical protein
MLDWSLLMGFSIPIKIVQLLIFSSNKFLKQQIGTFKLTKLKLFKILKLTCIQFSHNFKKDIAKRQKCFHASNERETQNQNNIKSLLLDANLLS